MVDIHLALGISGAIGLAVAGLTWLVDRRLGTDPDLRPRQPMARPEARPDCFACILAATASDDHLARHLRLDHAA
jgi:hypothetical protein